MPRTSPIGWWCVALTLSVACTNNSIPFGDDDSDSGDSSTTTEGDGPIPPPPVVIDTPPVVSIGAHVYVTVEDPLSELAFEIDGTPLPLAADLRADVPGGVFVLPPTLRAGRTDLVVFRLADPRSATSRAIELREPTFADVTETIGLAQVHDPAGNPTECAESHTGIAVGDYDNDGDPDFFVGNVGRGGTLHENQGADEGRELPTFVDVTATSGLDTGVQVSMATFVDLEGDGDLDLFVGRRGENRVYENQLAQAGAAHFVDVTAKLGLDAYDQRTMGVAFGDYDGDDDLDLYVVNHAYCFPTAGSEIRADDHLYRNDGGVFLEVTELLDPVAVSPVGFSASWVDVERDGDVDLIVINDDVGGDIGNPNVLWRNDGPGDGPGSWRFSDVSTSSGIGLAHVNGMGLALGDVNHDGFVDLAFSNIGANRLLLNTGSGTFLDVSQEAGIERAGLPWARRSITWATHLWDHDNDGDLDLYYSGGRIKGTAAIPDALLTNEGDGTFVERTWELGLTDPASGKASVLLDLDRDGYWELATTAWGEALRVYRNRGASLDAGRHHFVDIELEGRGGNREAVGAIVQLDTADGSQTCFHTNRPSLGGGGETACHFGLGERTTIDALTITWPNGDVRSAPPPAIDSRIRYVQPSL